MHRLRRVSDSLGAVALHCGCRFELHKIYDSIEVAHIHSKTLLTHTFAKLKKLHPFLSLFQAPLTPVRIASRKRIVQPRYTHLHINRRAFATMATLDDNVKKRISNSYPQVKDLDSDPAKISFAAFENTEVAIPNPSTHIDPSY